MCANNDDDELITWGFSFISRGEGLGDRAVGLVV